MNKPITTTAEPMEHATKQFVRGDDTLIVVLPWLPFVSATPVFKGIGLAALTFVGLWLTLSWRRRGHSDGRAGASAILVLLAVGLAATRSLQTQTAVQLVQLILIALAMRVGPLLRFTWSGVRICTITCIVLALLALVDVASGTSGLFDNVNSYGVAGLCWGAILLKLLVTPVKRVRLLRLLMCLALPLALTVISDSRASIAAFLTVLIWPLVSSPIRSARLRAALPLMVLALPLAAIVLVVAGRLTAIEDLLPLVGEKSPFSGRDIIWLNIISEIDANGYRGFGLGSLPGGVLTPLYEGLSAHNGFLQVLYQFGAVGLAVFFIACGLVIAKVAQRPDRGVSVAILVGGLLQEVFEVVLTQNHFGAGLLLWLIVTIQVTTLLPRRPISA